MNKEIIDVISCDDCRHVIKIEESYGVSGKSYHMNNYCTLTGKALFYPIKSCSRYEVNDV